MARAKFIFAGPSLAGSQLDFDPSITLLPPCKQGDIYLAAREGPVVIGIVDGFFEGSPSVWHKEIIWALSQGIHVVGAASMGALRAAETQSFGMQGLGWIYEKYRDGELEDDDEVALIHGPAEMNFLPLSLAMVNVRATLSHAVDCGVVQKEDADHILKLAKSLFYKSRTWEQLFACDGLSKLKNQEKLRHWLVDNEIDQKRLDAEALYKFVAESDFPKPFEPNFTFEQTEFWYRCTRTWDRRKPAPPPKPDATGYRLFD